LFVYYLNQFRCKFYFKNGEIDLEVAALSIEECFYYWFNATCFGNIKLFSIL